jgi:hypothetical protein
MRHQLHTEITIDAPAEVVWDVLIDLGRYTDWNPFIVAASGRPELGERLTNRIHPPGGRKMTFRPTVTELEHGQIFEWLGRLGLPGIFDGRHRFELRPNEDGTTTLIHGEQFNGLLVRFMKKSLDTGTMAGFEAMNVALKDRAEARVRCTP